MYVPPALERDRHEGSFRNQELLFVREIIWPFPSTYSVRLQNFIFLVQSLLLEVI